MTTEGIVELEFVENGVIITGFSGLRLVVERVDDEDCFFIFNILETLARALGYKLSSDSVVKKL